MPRKIDGWRTPLVNGENWWEVHITSLPRDKDKTSVGKLIEYGPIPDSIIQFNNNI
jgi:hypothetical protein